MWFGQKIYTRDGARQFGKWRPYETRERALNAGCHWVSILEIACTVAEFEAWRQHQIEEGRNPDHCRLQFPFRGPFYADFDRKQDVPGLQRDLAAALQRLIDIHGLKPETFQLGFSGGKGFHLEIPATVFGAENLVHRHLPRIYKNLASSLGFADIIDPSVYSESRGRLWRVAGKPRANGCRKIPITFEDLQTQSFEILRRRSQHPANPRFAPVPKLKPHPALTTLFKKAMKEAEAKHRRIPKNHAAYSIGPSGKLPEKERQRIELALSRLSPEIADDYHGWVTIGMALHHGTGGSSEGFHLWDTWSRQSEKYNAEATASKWPTFQLDDEDGITLGTLFYLAGAGFTGN